MVGIVRGVVVVVCGGSSSVRFSGVSSSVRFSGGGGSLRCSGGVW